MADVVNLNQYRKAKAKAAAKKSAAENRVRKGRTKEVKSILEIELEKARREHEQHKRDD